MKNNRKLSLILTLIAASALAPCERAQAAKLVQYWPLDEGSGTTVENAVSDGNTGTLETDSLPVTWQTSVPSVLTHSTQSILFGDTSSSGQRINCGNVGLRNSCTISVWLNPTSYGGGDMFLFLGLPVADPHGGFIRWDPLGTGYIQISSSPYFEPGRSRFEWLNLAPLSAVPPGEWTHVALCYDGGLVKMYANGVLVGTQPAWALNLDVTTFYMGGRNYGNNTVFDGAMDDISLWDGPLSPDSIAKLAAGNDPRTITDVPVAPVAAKLVQYWDFDDDAPSLSATNSVSGGNVGALNNFDGNTAWITAGLPALSGDVAAVKFDRSFSQFVDLGSLDLAGNGSFSFWINPDDNTDGICIYSQETGGTNMPGGVSFCGIGGLACWDGNGWQRIAADGAVPKNQWSHVAVTYSKGVVTAFVNGLPQISGYAGCYFSTNADGTANNCGLGSPFQLANAQYFSGKIDDVSVWSQALSPASISSLAGGTSPLSITDVPDTTSPSVSLTAKVATGAPPSLVHYWPLTGQNGDTTAYDLGSGENIGTLRNYSDYSASTWVRDNLPPNLTNTSCLRFNGNNQYVNVGNLGVRDRATLAMWVNSESMDSPGYFFMPLSGLPQGYPGIGGGGDLWILMNQGWTTDLNYGIRNAYQWYHLAYVYEGGQCTLYVDGVQRGSPVAQRVFMKVAGGR